MCTKLLEQMPSFGRKSCLWVTLRFKLWSFLENFLVNKQRAVWLQSLRSLVCSTCFKYSYFPRICITKHESVFLTQEVKWWNIDKRQKNVLSRFMWQISKRQLTALTCNSFIRWLVESAWSVYWLSAINHSRA